MFTSKGILTKSVKRQRQRKIEYIGSMVTLGNGSGSVTIDSHYLLDAPLDALHDA